jgi:hypothetical protein
MKNPSTANGTGAFRVTSTATLTSPVDDTCGTLPATLSGVRFFWDRASNSVQPWPIQQGRIRHG